jgi:alpha-beta hydrolase superfamily lysophospholipase
MIKEIFTFQDASFKTLYAYKWHNNSNDLPKAAVQIIHGMSEHAQRYELFAKSLVDAGFIVYANDHRGHGKTAGNIKNTGYFADSNGWNIVLENIQQLKTILIKENPGAPIFIFGHSMGSLLLRNFIFKYPENIQGIILSGTSYTSPILIKLGRTIAKIQRFFKGKKYKSRLLDSLSFGNFNKKFKPVKTPFDWLSKDKIEVEKYIKDDYCGFCCSTQFYIDLFNGIQNIQKKLNIKQIPENLPIFIIAGTNDAVGNYTKGTIKVQKLLIEAGLKNVKLKFYNEARHELTNEIIKYQVFKEIIAWIEKEKASF